jgi:cell division protein FtsN
MAARRGRNQARRNNGQHRVPAWIWLLAGLLIGLALAAVVLIRDGFDARRLLQPQPNPAAQAPREPEPPVAQQVEPTANRKPEYEFYSLLRETRISDEEIREQARREQARSEQPSPPVAAEERLSLQAGAFSDPQRAEKIKAEIAFTGLVARVEPTATGSGATVHRVMLGPFASMRELEAAKQRLAGSGIEAIATREPAGR